MCAIWFVQGSAHKQYMKKIDHSNNRGLTEGSELLLSSTEFNEGNGDRPGFLSATVNTKLTPFQGKMTDAEKIVFQSGVREFLQDMLEKEANVKNLYVVSCTITKHELPYEKDPNILRLQNVISAQHRENDGDAAISETKFGEIIVNLLNIFDDKLINVWREYENNSIITVGETELNFNTVEKVIVEIDRPQASRKRIGLMTIIISSCIGVLLFALAIAIKRKRFEEKNASESASLTGFPFAKSKLSSHKNIQDLIKRDDFTFAPYTDVQLAPPRRQRHNRYSKMKANVTDQDTSNDDQEYGIVGLPACSSGEITFDDDSIVSKLSGNPSALKAVCFAPPGKLGVAIDTINRNPVVHRVSDGSPLTGILRRLDVIIAVDDVDTTSMSAAEVTSLMTKRMGTSRKITYMRGEVVQQFLMERENSFQ